MWPICELWSLGSALVFWLVKFSSFYLIGQRSNLICGVQVQIPCGPRRTTPTPTSHCPGPGVAVNPALSYCALEFTGWHWTPLYYGCQSNSGVTLNVHHSIILCTGMGPWSGTEQNSTADAKVPSQSYTERTPLYYIVHWDTMQWGQHYYRVNSGVTVDFIVFQRNVQVCALQ